MPLMVQPLLTPPVLFLRIRHSSNPKQPRIDSVPGITGVLSEVEFADGQIVGVLSNPPLFKRRLPRKGVPIAPAGVAATADDPRFQGPGRSHLGFRVKDFRTADALLNEARDLGRTDGLWIVSGELDLLGELRGRGVATRLVYSCVPADHEGGSERLAATLRTMGIDGALMPELDLTGGTVALFHRFTRLLLADGANHVRSVRRALERGADGVVGTDVDAFAAATL